MGRREPLAEDDHAVGGAAARRPRTGLEEERLDGLSEAQRALNRSSADRWDLFAGHRRRLTGLVLDAARAAPARIGVLGAGNCNDLDLRRLVDAAAAVHLVDIDGEALRRGVERQGLADDPRVVLHDGFDISGLGPLLGGARPPAPDALIRAAQLPSCGTLPRDFDVVVSPCVLTQLIESAAAALDAQHPAAADVALAVRAGHLRTLLDLVRPGGTVVLATEVASSDSLPALRAAPDEDLGPLLLNALATGRLFDATSPAAIVHWIAAERPARARLAPPGVAGPWRWVLRPRLHYLVVALLLERRAGSGDAPTRRDTSAAAAPLRAGEDQRRQAP